VLRVDVTGVDRVRPVARRIRALGRPGDYRCYDVDHSPGFRYCLERDIDPTPAADLRTLAVDCPATELADPPVTELTVREGVGKEVGEAGSNDDGGSGSDPTHLAGDPATVLDDLDARLRELDPDVLVLSSAALVPTLAETADRLDHPFRWGRLPGYRQLASASTYESYGRVGHSPARYEVPGRALVDRSNTFLWAETNLAGCLDLVERSRKPLQELSWASIGTVLTALQVRAARDRGVLVPWRSWRHEFFKTARQLHAADRGGVTLAPEVGVHETVHEVDFASLYPNIIRTRNVSPDAIRCDCHADRADVPELGYAICDERGYLPDVLGPLIDTREDIKRELTRTEDPDRRAALEGRSSAIKWILVSCFGYQGFSNAKFGRIECHEAINAFAREILLDAKATLEAGGWRVLHGIVDSLWVTAREADPTPLSTLCERVSDEAGIRLEHEAAYDWVAFVPRADDEVGALTRYFGALRDGGYKYRGIECRKDSTPPLVADAQRDLVRVFDETRDPEAVCARLREWVGRLARGAVAPEDLLVETRVSKSVEAYEAETRTVAALRRSADLGLARAPGQRVSYVVVDDDAAGRARVRVAAELDGDSVAYDTAFYRDLLVRAAESVLAPTGRRRVWIERQLGDGEQPRLTAF
jgi:DNA polymerase I